ncbi:hypothetical protein K438DRAFT_484339 [Mycena galopus ATCC 62051]|nr:hypothetical protein K438DRAFT_484339 [Mycena galopus ATCC 62051]
MHSQTIATGPHGRGAGVLFAHRAHPRMSRTHLVYDHKLAGVETAQEMDSADIHREDSSPLVVRNYPATQL